MLGGGGLEDGRTYRRTRSGAPGKENLGDDERLAGSKIICSGGAGK